MTTHRSATVILGLTSLMILGCGGDGAAPAEVSASEASVTKGLEAATAKDWATAERELDGAIKAGALQPDQSEQAMLALARARVELGKLDEASVLITELELGAAAMDQVLLVKAELLLKKGDAAGARAAFTEAKTHNAALTAPAGL
jgi:Tfp pilus assembly protein PilF